VGSCFVNLITRNIIVQLDYRNDAPFRNYGHSKFHNPSCMWRKILQPSSPYSCTQWQKLVSVWKICSVHVCQRVSRVFLVLGRYPQRRTVILPCSTIFYYARC
jgi:hypothetical protein